MEKITNHKFTTTGNLDVEIIVYNERKFVTFWMCRKMSENGIQYDNNPCITIVNLERLEKQLQSLPSLKNYGFSLVDIFEMGNILENSRKLFQ